eukprot:6185963-Pyramimonas_sp.AAC.1
MSSTLTPLIGLKNENVLVDELLELGDELLRADAGVGVALRELAVHLDPRRGESKHVGLLGWLMANIVRGGCGRLLGGDDDVVGHVVGDVVVSHVIPTLSELVLLSSEVRRACRRVVT